MWPINSKLSDPQFKQEMKLCTVRYRFNSDKKLCGLQLIFTNGTSSPEFEAEDAEEVKDKKQKTGQWEKSDLDPNMQISSVEFFVCNENRTFSIQALRFRDSDGVVVQCITKVWPLAESWSSVANNAVDDALFAITCVKAEIPLGQEIIGIQVNTRGETLGKLGFIIWEPNVKADKLTLKPPQ